MRHADVLVLFTLDCDYDIFLLKISASELYMTRKSG